MSGGRPTCYAVNPDGEEIAYRVTGDGPRDIVLLVPGNAIDLVDEDPVFDAVQARLAGLGRLIFFDWRGFGSSDPLDGLPSPEGWMDDTRVVLDAVGSTEAAIIAPTANGTMGLLFAATYPERTSALVLVDSWARIAWAEDHSIGLSPEALERFIDVVAANWGVGGLAAFDVPSRHEEPGFEAWYTRQQRLTLPRGKVRPFWRWNVQVDARPALSAVSAPTLVIHHEQHPLYPVSLGRHVAAEVRGARLVLLPGPGENWFFSRAASRGVLDAVEEFLTGAPPVGEVDRVLATVLFTDIVGSTEHAVRLGDAEWRQRLDAHDRIVDVHLAEHRGHRVKSTGDGVLATFDGPGRAIRCAQAISSSIRATGLEVRAGLHTGEVERRGEDIGGVAVHIAARVAGLAGPSEVLVSSTVRDLVAGSGIGFASRGVHDLKGLSEPWSVFEVVDGAVQE